MRACARNGFYFYFLLLVPYHMTCLYCFTAVLPFRFKKVHGSGERDAFALMYCRVDQVQQMAPIKKRAIDYRSFFFSLSFSYSSRGRDDYFRAFLQRSP